MIWVLITCACAIGIIEWRAWRSRKKAHAQHIEALQGQIDRLLERYEDAAASAQHWKQRAEALERENEGLRVLAQFAGTAPERHARAVFGAHQNDDGTFSPDVDVEDLSGPGAFASEEACLAWANEFAGWVSTRLGRPL